MLLRLPTEMLMKIASHSTSPGLVVAAGKNTEARTALRKGTDIAERARFGGIGFTVREAEQIIRTRYRYVLEDRDLETRRAAGLALIMKTQTLEDDDYDGDGDDRLYEGLVVALIAYGVDVNVPENGGHDIGHVLLHVAYQSDDPVELARLLLAAGADIDARCTAPNGAGLSPLAWCIDCGNATESSYALACFLIEQGCDVVQTAADYTYQASRRTLTAHFRSGPEDIEPEGERLEGLIDAALEVAGPELRYAADIAAQELPRNSDNY